MSTLLESIVKYMIDIIQESGIPRDVGQMIVKYFGNEDLIIPPGFGSIVHSLSTNEEVDALWLKVNSWVMNHLHAIEHGGRNGGYEYTTDIELKTSVLITNNPTNDPFKHLNGRLETFELQTDKWKIVDQINAKFRGTGIYVSYSGSKLTVKFLNK